MALKEQLFEDLKSAMKEKDTIRKDTVQLIRSGILQIEKDNKIELDDKGVIEVIAKQLKSRKQDLVDKLNKEIEILLNYLPEQLSESAIQKVVEETIAELGATSLKDLGKVMKAITPKIKGVADGKVVSNIVKNILMK